MQTLTFKEIFPNYTTYKEYTDNLGLYASDDTDAELLNQRIFYLLYNRYLDTAVAYNTPDSFLAEFGIVYLEYFTQFLTKQNVLKEIYKLTSEDYLIVGESISNYANNPNYEQTDPFEFLTYTSNQTRGRTKSNKLIAYVNALRNLPDGQINYMISKFDYLFLDILETEDIYYF